MGEKGGKENKKVIKKLEDGLLLVVLVRIHGKKVKAFIDSGTTRCFVSASFVDYVGLKGIPRDVFLELGN